MLRVDKHGGGTATPFLRSGTPGVGQANVTTLYRSARLSVSVLRLPTPRPDPSPTLTDDFPCPEGKPPLPYKTLISTPAC